MGLEGMRGMAAFFVALSHVFYLNILSPQIQLNPLLRSVEGGQAGVLIFFVLSGYVITWTNAGIFSGQAALRYVKRRWVRIYPIYFLAMLVTLAAMRFAGLTETRRVIVGSFLCLQNFNGYFGPGLNPPRANNALWSLNYEVLYYLVFLLLWRYRPRLSIVFVPAAVAGVLGWFAPRFMPLFISSYACGWILWATGWWLATQPRIDPGKEKPTPLASWILLIYAGHNINGFARISNALHFYCTDSGMVSLANLGLLPAILLALAAVARRELPHRKWIVFAAWAICLVPISGMIATGRLLSYAPWIDGTVAVCLAALLLGWRSVSWLRPFAWLGGISYAFYVLHFPLLYVFKYAPFPQTTVFGFVARLVSWAAATMALSWLLEKRLQPWVKKLFLGAPKTPD
ncbi:MAG TPA: acyltransferase [Opitutaceae bacterium]